MTSQTQLLDRPLPAEIDTVADLEAYLNAALRLEHATIPPYLTALYSLHPGTNSDARHVIRVVAVEEMLHLTLVANVMNAIGRRVDLTADDFVPAYPAHLPSGETDFLVSVQPFSPAAVTTFLNIERPAKAPSEGRRLLPYSDDLGAGTVLAASPLNPGVRFYSIGEFYAEIDRGLRHLDHEYRQRGEELFSGDPAWQVTEEYFYSGGGEVVPVTDLASALRALTLIAEQGEGLGGGIYDGEGELSHYYRFEQIQLARYYQKGDVAARPSGPRLDVDFSAVYPVAIDTELADYPAGTPAFEAAETFSRTYADFLAYLTAAYHGQPHQLLDAVAWMFRLRDDMNRLIRNPFPGRPGVHASPVFGRGPLERS
ncbi:ferritin-like domain-containing protein [Jidongwangia harbinensis]|uniref:ferritin-like domain-containing protein n=1 Tax=Jidongwangia harbinensis TaxID=2878561 RepID=UPI001CD9ED4D|nr:ferritin-like protein [Jidongwangia harbinensis]MCA2211362.1 ferritin-like protein [Jidongwangia harbinensis]